MNIKISFACLLIPLTVFSSQDFSIALKNNKKNIALIIAYKGYHPVEYTETKRVLEQAGFSVTTISTQSGYARTLDNSRTLVDKALNKFKPLKFDGIFLIGGPGADRVPGMSQRKKELGDGTSEKNAGDEEPEYRAVDRIDRKSVV